MAERAIDCAIDPAAAAVEPKALNALRLLNARQRLRLSEGPLATAETLLDEWAADKTPPSDKAMIAATRAEVADLNARARSRLVERGIVRDAKGMDIEITRRDESTESKRFAPGDRIVFTKNDRTLGVANGSTGTIQKIQRAASGSALIVELDTPNERGETTPRVPASFRRLDHAYCLTNHKSQGRTLGSAHVLVNPAMADREWISVAASRSRFATTLHVDRSAILSADPESHLQPNTTEFDRAAAIECLARSMSRSRAKGTTLDYAVAPGAGGRGDTISREEQEALTIDRQHHQVEGNNAIAPIARAMRPRATQSMDNQPEARR